MVFLLLLLVALRSQRFDRSVQALAQEMTGRGQANDYLAPSMLGDYQQCRTLGRGAYQLEPQFGRREARQGATRCR